MDYVFSPKSDVWSFGVVCFEIICQEIPYKQYQATQFAAKASTLKLVDTLPKDLNSNVFELIASTQQREPERRPDFEELVSKLNVLTGEDPMLQRTISEQKKVGPDYLNLKSSTNTTNSNLNTSTKSNVAIHYSNFNGDSLRNTTHQTPQNDYANISDSSQTSKQTQSQSIQSDVSVGEDYANFKDSQQPTKQKESEVDYANFDKSKTTTTTTQNPPTLEYVTIKKKDNNSSVGNVEGKSESGDYLNLK